MYTDPRDTQDVVENPTRWSFMHLATTLLRGCLTTSCLFLLQRRFDIPISSENEEREWVRPHLDFTIYTKYSNNNMWIKKHPFSGCFFYFIYSYLFLPVFRRETINTFEYFLGVLVLRPPVTLPHIVFGLLVPRPCLPSPPPYG